jgi:hypothetical protein
MPSQKATRRTRNERLAEIQRAQARADRRRNMVWLVVGIVVLAGITAGVVFGVKGKHHKSNLPPGPVPTLSVNAAHTKLDTGQPLNTSLITTQWTLPTDATPYLAAAGVTALPQETLAVHYHAHVDININGTAVPFPQGVGFVISGGKVKGLSPLHTHDSTGVLHIESPLNKKFTLGQFFVELGLRLTPNCIGGFCTGHGKVFKVFLDGKQYTQDPNNLVLASHQEIALWYGDVNAKPDVPSSYQFPPNE